MKKILLLLVFSFILKFSVGQNLVPNHSFEIHTLCGNFNRIYWAVPWFQPCIYSGNTTNSSSSDLLSACAPSFCNCGVPINNRGFQYARTDSTYAGIYEYDDTVNGREYIEVPLIMQLIANNTYCVEYYVSLANDYGTAISNMGAYFSLDSLLVPSYQAIDTVIPQIENPLNNMLSDTLNWMLVSGSFVANGGEKFMTIGNFHNPANTNTQVVNPNAGTVNRAYYYIDDVSVVDCTSGVGVGSELGVMNDELGVMPNPATTSIVLTTNNQQPKTIAIYNVLGCEMLSFDKLRMTSRETIDVSTYPSGIYFVEVQTESFDKLRMTGVVRKKFVKQ